MMGLVQTYDGDFSLTDIASIQYRAATAGNAERYIVNKLSGRGTSMLFSHQYEDLMARPIHLSPATPGTFLLRGYVDDEGASLDAQPILAWAICVDGQTRPVLPDGVLKRPGYEYRPDFVRLPDGGIYQFGCEVDPGRYADEDAVLAYLKIWHQRQLEQRARDAAEREPRGDA